MISLCTEIPPCATPGKMDKSLRPAPALEEAPAEAEAVTPPLYPPPPCPPIVLLYPPAETKLEKNPIISYCDGPSRILNLPIG